uniref:Pyrophosphate--fructose 6-phosphate 1-phosphotransferase n=1 Tax=Phaeomonas parva TaxID=124430 RepID=A0A7S1U0B8_9STRA|mmetsp:Transcript_23694/g.74555  ORF Transcript_23694/g.74555 Transcript_23694/m.74555 type:complete len:1252 (+) Transcript_23694:541-4296(+)
MMEGTSSAPAPAVKEARIALSGFDKSRSGSLPVTPSVLDASRVRVVEKEALGAAADHEAIEAKFPKCYGKPRVEFEASDVEGFFTGKGAPLRIGCVLSGGQAPGGHNVIAGIFDSIKARSPDSVMIGFLDGPHGIYTGNYIEIDDARMDLYRNTGGFDMLGSGRHKIEKPEHFLQSMQVCTALRLDGLVVIGGDDSNTNACLLAEYFLQNNCATKVCGAPKTIDGDLRNTYIPISFGFDTACKVYAEQVSNVMTDALSSQKYYHFCRLMGRAASNIALEVALLTGPNVCLISEEVAEHSQSLSGISKNIAQIIQQRAQNGKDYGVVLLPEGLIEFVPEFHLLIEEINDILAGDTHADEERVVHALSFNSKAVFSYLPQDIKSQLLLDRDPHGNVQVAKIETERLLALCVGAELELLREQGSYDGSFRPQFHSFGYEGRCAAPTRFDAAYCYAIGRTVGMLIAAGQTGMMASITNMLKPAAEWTCGGVPITMMMNMEHRHGKDKPVIKKALVELDGRPFQRFTESRDYWALADVYRIVGPTQFSEDLPGSFAVPLTTRLEFAKTPAEMPPPLMATGDHDSYLVDGRNKPILIFNAGPTMSDVSTARQAYEPQLPACLGTNGVGVSAYLGESVQNAAYADEEAANKTLPLTSAERPLVTLAVPNAADAKFHRGTPVDPTSGPFRIGVAYCGRQSPGGHNILVGLSRAVEARADGSQLIGFVGGTSGIISRSYIELNSGYLELFKNTGGFVALGRTVDRIRGTAVASTIAACRDLRLDGLVLIGGSRTASDGAKLAEAMETEGVSTTVTAVPCGADGRMTNVFVPISVGFHTMSSVTASLVGNLAIDASSARKYWYFVRCIGGEASHIAAEVALTTQPNAILIAEEVAARRQSLGDIVRYLADIVAERAEEDRNFGLVIVPEGLLPAVPEVGVLIAEIDDLFKTQTPSSGRAFTVEEVIPSLTAWSAALLQALPVFAQEQLLLERQSDGKLQLQQVETEKLLAVLVGEELKRRKNVGQYSGKYSFVNTFIGYQARSSMPTNFDAALGLAHGVAAASMVFNKLNGYMTALSNLTAQPSKWIADAIPMVALLAGKALEVVPAKLAMDSPEMTLLREVRESWTHQDAFVNPGPLQLHDASVTRPTRISQGKRDYLLELAKVREALTRVHRALRPGVDQGVLQISRSSLMNLVEIIATLERGENTMDEPDVAATIFKQRIMRDTMAPKPVNGMNKMPLKIEEMSGDAMDMAALREEKA